MVPTRARIKEGADTGIEEAPIDIRAERFLMELISHGTMPISHLFGKVLSSGVGRMMRLAGISRPP
jgi:hypothetical protein